MNNCIEVIVLRGSSLGKVGVNGGVIFFSMVPGLGLLTQSDKPSLLSDIHH